MDQSVQHPELAGHEVELKLEVDPAAAALVEQIPLLHSAPKSARDQLTVYYDTPSEKLRDHGFTLRVRSSGGKFVQTLKPAAESAGLMSREETEWPVESIEPDVGKLRGTALEPLLREGRLDRLKPVIRSEVQRTSWALDLGSGRIQVDFDRGEISAGGASQRFVELELELLEGEPACLLAAAKAVAEYVPVHIGVLSKAERGARLASGAFERISKAAPVRIEPGMNVAEAFEVMVHACLRHYRLNEPLVIAERIPGALHQSRVAMRRLRSAFALFKSAIADVEYQYLREELRWFTNQLGDARNLDVYLMRDLPDDERETLTARRERAYDQVIAAMNSPRLRRLMLELVGWTAFGPWRSGRQAAKPVEAYAGRRLDRLWDMIAALGPELAHLDEETRHELRIQVKKMRYAIEFLRALYPAARADEKRFAAAVEELQETLGKLNDLATAKSLVSSPAQEEWLIGEPEERIHLREAERAFRDLAAVGPFWRARHHHPHHAELA